MSEGRLLRSGVRNAAFVLAMAVTANVAAQTPVITSPPQVVVAGPDYATDWLANPWDFSDSLDVSPFPDEFPGWTNSSTTARTVGRNAFLNGGRFIATAAFGGNSLIPVLNRGGSGVDSLTENTGFFTHKAIPTARYGKLSLALTLSAQTAGAVVAFFYAGPYGVDQGRGVAVGKPLAGTHIYTVDLVTGTWHDPLGNAMPSGFLPIGNYNPVPWNGTSLMRGLHLRPTSDGNASVDVQVDWVRLTQRDGQADTAVLPIAFSGCPDREYSIEVSADGSTWDVIHAGTASGASTTTAFVNYGVLPPGGWPFRVTCYSTNRVSGTPTSSQPVNVTINHPPIPTVLSPDAAGGGDFATEVLRDPWDWNALSDARLIANIGNPAIVYDGFTNTLQGTGASNGDPAVFLLYGNGQIDTSRYRMLTFTETLDTPFGLDGARGDGSVARVFWERALGSMGAVTVTRDILIWPGRNVYTFDLATLTAANGGLDPSCAGCPTWQATPTVRGFRIDPHEATRGVAFRLGQVRLAAFDEVRLGSVFPIQYSFVDTDLGNYEARIYLDTDLDRTGMALLDTITSGVVPNTILTYSFDPAGRGVPPGVYHVYVEIVETGSGITEANGSYSGGPIAVASTGGPLPPGAPTLSAVQTAANPITVAWSAGPGGPPTNYTICGGITPGGTQLGCYDMGLSTAVSAAVPAGVAIYARVVASNPLGSAISNEVAFVVGGGRPGQPTINPAVVSGRTVSLSWNASAAGGAPSSYLLIPRLPGNPNPITVFPIAGNAATVPGVPPGDYVVTVVAVNAAGISPESNAIIVSVR